MTVLEAKTDTDAAVDVTGTVRLVAGKEAGITGNNAIDEDELLAVLVLLVADGSL